MSPTPSAPPHRLERDVVREILLATSHLVDWMRNPSGVAVHPDGSTVRYGLGSPGGADLIGVLRGPGTLVACEVKSPTGRLRPEQDTFLRRMRASGALAFVARSAGDVLEALGGK